MTPRLIQIPLTSVAVQISAIPAYFNQMIIQNNAVANCRYGDATVSATRGIQLYAGGGSASIGTVSGQQGDASQFWVFGTSGDVVDVLLW